MKTKKRKKKKKPGKQGEENEEESKVFLLYTLKFSLSNAGLLLYNVINKYLYDVILIFNIPLDW